MSDTPVDDYFRQENLQFVDRLGHGKDGDVIQTSRPFAVKFLYSKQLYRRELRMYRILHEQNIHQINPFQLPRWFKNEDRFRAIEMSIVTVPYMLDFASSYDDE